MLRDFSDAAKQKLLNYVDEVTANGTWDKVKEWFSNIEPNVQSWLGRLDIQKYVNSVECYYKKILDKNNSTKHHGKADRGDLFERAGSGYQIYQYYRQPDCMWK